MVYKFFDKISRDTNNHIGAGTISENTILANELHKSITRKIQRRKLYPSYQGYSLGNDLAEMQVISKYNKEVILLLCVMDIYSKHAWIVLLKDKFVYLYYHH